jgi:site-specific DNA-methyltransferase (adenine-specific)
MDTVISADTPFGLATNFSNYKVQPFDGSVALYFTKRGKRMVAYTDRSSIKKNTHLIDSWKVLLPKAYGERGAIPAMVLGPSIVAPPASVCTQTYLVLGGLANQEEANSAQNYTKTRFFRFLVSLRKITQDVLRSTYSWVPQQTWDRIWTDEMLYEKYGITDEEIAFINSMIRPMDISEVSEDD